MITFRTTLPLMLAGAVLAGCTAPDTSQSRVPLTDDPVMTKYDAQSDGGGGCPGGGRQGTAGGAGECLPDYPQDPSDPPRIPGQPQSGGGNQGGGPQGGRP